MLRTFGKRLIGSGVPLPIRMMPKLLEWALLRDTLARLQVNCVLDVGAHRGQFATSLRRIGYRGQIVSFEPVAEAFATLDATFSRDARWRGYNLALGNESGVRPFNVALESTEMSSFLAPLDSGWKLRVESVAMQKLDLLFDEIVAQLPGPPRIFLKMDTQGYDLEVLQGAAASLPAVVGLQSELSVWPVYQRMPSYLQALEYYERQGFRLLGLVEAARTERGLLLEMNCVMARREQLIA